MNSNIKMKLQMNYHAILNFWNENTIDKDAGGFYGKIDNSE